MKDIKSVDQPQNLLIQIYMSCHPTLPLNISRHFKSALPNNIFPPLASTENCYLLSLQFSHFFTYWMTRLKLWVFSQFIFSFLQVLPYLLCLCKSRSKFNILWWLPMIWNIWQQLPQCAFTSICSSLSIMNKRGCQSASGNGLSFYTG